MKTDKRMGVWLAAVAVVVAGCGSAPASSVPGAAVTVIVPQTVVVRETVIMRETIAAPPTAQVIPTATVASSAPVAFSGSGQTATEMFELRAGLVVFELTHDGKRNFIVHLLDQNGKQVGMSLVNHIGPFDGSKAVQIPSGGRYLLNVAADGKWSIKTR